MNLEVLLLDLFVGGILLLSVAAGIATVVGLFPGGWIWRSRQKLVDQLRDRRIEQLDEDDALFFGPFSKTALALGMTVSPFSGGLPEFIGTKDAIDYRLSAERDALHSTLAFGDSYEYVTPHPDAKAVEVIHGVVRISAKRVGEHLQEERVPSHRVVPWVHSRMPDALFTGSLEPTVLALARLSEREFSGANQDGDLGDNSADKQPRSQTPKPVRGLQINFSPTEIQLRKSSEDSVPELLPLFNLAKTLIHATSENQSATRLRQLAQGDEDAGNRVLARIALASHPSWERMDEVLLFRSLVQLTPNDHFTNAGRSKLILERVIAELDGAERTPLLMLLSDIDLIAAHPLSHMLVSYLSLSDEPLVLAALTAALATCEPEACLAAARHLTKVGHKEALEPVRAAVERVALLNLDVAGRLLVQANLLHGQTSRELGGRLTVIDAVDAGQLSLERGAGRLAVSVAEERAGGVTFTSEPSQEASDSPKRPPQKIGS